MPAQREALKQMVLLVRPAPQPVRFLHYQQAQRCGHQGRLLQRGARPLRAAVGILWRSATGAQLCA